MEEWCKPIYAKRSMFRHWQQPVYFSGVEEIGCYSTDPIGQCHLNSRMSLKPLFISTPPRPADFNLRKGYETFIDNEELSSSTTFQFLKELPPHQKPDFVCGRSLLTLLMSTPYEKYDTGSWLLGVTKFRGTYFIFQLLLSEEEEEDEEEEVEEEEEEEEHEEQESQSALLKEMCYWGFKFEQYMTSDSPSQPPNTDVPVNCKQNFYSIMRSQLASHSLMYTSEIDCYDSQSVNSDNPIDSYVELKTSRQMTKKWSSKQFYGYKTVKMWAQSYIGGVKKILCGFRDDEGIVRCLKWFKTNDLPNLSQGAWKKETCLAFLDYFLTSIKNIDMPDDPCTAHAFEWNMGSDRIRVCKILSESPIYLPQWFIEEH